MRIVWTKPARQDLRDIFEYISKDNLVAATALLTEIKERVTILHNSPNLGRQGRMEGTRELVLTGTHYILPYRIKNQQIQILSVFHTSRNWADNHN